MQSKELLIFSPLSFDCQEMKPYINSVILKMKANVNSRKTVLVISFLLFSTLCSAQSMWTSFWSLAGPEKCWVITHPFIANKARKITREVLRYSEEVKKDSPLDEDANGGQADAFRHAFWMASLSQKISERKALSLGKAHEKGDYRKFRKGKMGEEGLLPDSASSEMDIFNNKAGASIGSQNKYLEKDSLRAIIISTILNGRLKIISKNKEGRYLDCAGNILDMASFIHIWNIPKCLVNSDQTGKIK
jgi:hypothetical protein